MQFFEIAYGKPEGFVRNLFHNSTEKEELLEELRLKCPKDTDCYMSVYDYEFDSEPTRDSDFINAPKSGDFYVDLDGVRGHMQEVREELKTVVEHFTELGVDKENIQIYFSGGKGYHIVIPQEYFSFKDSKILHTYYKSLASLISLKYNLKYMDTVVYDTRRVLRICDTWNVKGGEMKELLDGNDNPIRSVISPLINLDDFQPQPVKPKEIQNSSATSGNIKLPIEPFMLRLINSEPEHGERNNTCYTIALYLKDHGYSEEEAYQILVHSPNSSPDDKKRSAVDSAYSGSKHFGLTNNDIVQNVMTQDEKIQFNVDDITNLLVPWKDVMSSTKNQIDKFQKKQMISYGIDTLDKYLGMIQATELVTVGGVPGIGKSEFVWNAAKANARVGIPVAFVGLEMTPEQYALRSVRNKVGLDANKFKTMDLTAEEKESVTTAVEKMSDEKLPIYFFNPKYKLDVNKLDKLIGAATEKFGIKLWVIDHLHYFPTYSTNKDETTNAIANIVTAIKQFTLKYELPIILVSHYRKLASGVSPSLNSFKDTAAIAQVSDTVIALNRDLITSDLGLQRRIEMSILKSRYGMPSATFYANFNPQSGEYSPSSDFRYGLSGTIFD